MANTVTLRVASMRAQPLHEDYVANEQANGGSLLVDEMQDWDESLPYRVTFGAAFNNKGVPPEVYWSDQPPLPPAPAPLQQWGTIPIGLTQLAGSAYYGGQ